MSQGSKFKDIDFVKDYYRVLGVNRASTSKDIQSAYRQLAKATHPDINPSKAAHKQFVDIQAAYDVLKDSTKKNYYDTHRMGGGFSPGGVKAGRSSRGYNEYGDIFASRARYAAQARRQRQHAEWEERQRRHREQTNYRHNRNPFRFNARHFFSTLLRPKTMAAVIFLYIAQSVMLGSPEDEEARTEREKMSKDLMKNTLNGKSSNNAVVNVFINPATGEWQRDQGQDRPKYWKEKEYHWLFLPAAHNERSPWEFANEGVAGFGRNQLSTASGVSLRPRKNPIREKRTVASYAPLAGMGSAGHHTLNRSHTSPYAGTSLERIRRKKKKRDKGDKKGAKKEGGDCAGKSEGDGMGHREVKGKVAGVANGRGGIEEMGEDQPEKETGAKGGGGASVDAASLDPNSLLALFRSFWKQNDPYPRQ